jgi:CheY-like chemotaxis protein
MSKFESILLVDDNANCIEFMILALDAEGRCLVTSETSPLFALARIREERPSVVLLDIKMPGVDGFEILARLRSEANAVPVIMLSGSSRQQDVDRAFALGCSGYFQKPNSLAGYRALARAVTAYWCGGELSAA